jgi:hypothetical protein
MNIRIIAGAIVQATSIIWPSNIYRLMYLLSVKVVKVVPIRGT